MKATRSEFLQSALACIAGITVAACGGDDNGADDPDDGGGTTGGACGTTIAMNHAHKLTVTKAQVMAGAAKTYDMQGDSMHGHTLALTAAHMATLAAGDPVTVDSSNDAGHVHAVTISCA